MTNDIPTWPSHVLRAYGDLLAAESASVDSAEAAAALIEKIVALEFRVLIAWAECTTAYNPTLRDDVISGSVRLAGHMRQALDREMGA